jgi:hypothetical protein
LLRYLLTVCFLATPILASAQDSRPVESFPDRELLEQYSRNASSALVGPNSHSYPAPYSYELAKAQAAMMELQRRASDRQERIVWLNTILAGASVLLAMVAVAAQQGQRHRHGEQLRTLRKLVRAAHANS